MSNSIINQIAFSVVDLKRTEAWFRETFALLPAGGTRSFRGPGARHVQGLPGAASTCWWLNDRNDYFQLEFFQFEKPITKLMSANSRPCDIGYSRVGLWSRDFDDTLERLSSLGTPPLTAPYGEPGDRRACVRSPDGVYVEIMEADPLAGRAAVVHEECPTATRSVTLSVPDLAKSRRFFVDAIGLKVADVELRRPEHESLWGLEGARSESLVLDAGNILLELVQYIDPVGKPWPDDHRISDQGILNIAFGYRRMKDQMAAYRRTRSAGAVPNGFPLHLVNWGVVYVNDEQEFSVELLWVNPRWDGQMGFKPLPADKRPQPDTAFVEQHIDIEATPSKVWDTLANHEGMPDWFPLHTISLSHDGAAIRNAVGTVRKMRGPNLNVTEQVIGWQPGKQLDYRLLDGAPVSCHQGNISLHSTADGTRVNWKIRFRPKIPGSTIIVKRALTQLLAKALSGLKRVIEAAE